MLSLNKLSFINMSSYTDIFTFCINPTKPSRIPPKRKLNFTKYLFGNKKI